MFNMFLVLGQVPGTNFQISFNELIIACLLVAVFLFARSYKRPQIVSRRLTGVYQLSRFNEYKETLVIQAGRSPHRKVSTLPANIWLHWLGQHWRIVR